MGKRGIFSVWLVPAKKDSLLFFQQIEALAKKYSSFVFTPHITLYRIKDISLYEFVATIRSHIDSVSATRIELDKPQFGSRVERTLYYPVKKTTTLASLHSNLSKSFHHYEPFSFEPHLSVLYKKDMSMKDKEIEKALLPSIPTITLTKLYIIQSVASLTEGNSTPSWKVIHEQLLY